MRLRHRLRRAEDKAGLKNHGPIPIIWDGRMEDEWKRRAELAEKRGCGVNLITFEQMLCADSKEEAEAVIQERLELDMNFSSIIVHRRGDPSDILATHEPELPDWLKVFEDGAEDSSK